VVVVCILLSGTYPYRCQQSLGETQPGFEGRVVAGCRRGIGACWAPPELAQRAAVEDPVEVHEVERREEPEGVGQAEQHARGDRGQAAEEEHGVPLLGDAQGDGDAGLEEGRPDGPGADMVRTQAGCYCRAAPAPDDGIEGSGVVGGMVGGGLVGSQRGRNRGCCCSGAPRAGRGGGAVRSGSVSIIRCGALSVIRPWRVRGWPRAVVHQGPSPRPWSMEVRWWCLGRSW
jgi:hypothetical protein